MVPKAVKDAQARSQAQRRMHDKRHLLNSEAIEAPRASETWTLHSGETEALAEPADVTDQDLCKRA